jgi:septal ring factor EnvC (AmiA/AmiB activator)
MILEHELEGKTLSPQEVRSILKTDNKEIVELCKRASILPRKNSKGQTYFSYDEVKNLRKVQAMKGATMPPAKSEVKQTSAVMNILNSLRDMENKLSDKISKVIDEKLEGMDEVVVELIRCKTDNETLRQKIIDLNKEIYQLKNELNSYKPIALGLYKKKERHMWE